MRSQWPFPSISLALLAQLSCSRVRVISAVYSPATKAEGKFHRDKGRFDLGEHAVGLFCRACLSLSLSLFIFSWIEAWRQQSGTSLTSFLSYGWGEGWRAEGGDILRGSWLAGVGRLLKLHKKKPS